MIGPGEGSLNFTVLRSSSCFRIPELSPVMINADRNNYSVKSTVMGRSEI